MPSFQFLLFGIHGRDVEFRTCSAIYQCNKNDIFVCFVDRSCMLFTCMHTQALIHGRFSCQDRCDKTLSWTTKIAFTSMMGYAVTSIIHYLPHATLWCVPPANQLFASLKLWLYLPSWADMHKHTSQAGTPGALVAVFHYCLLNLRNSI